MVDPADAPPVPAVYDRIAEPFAATRRSPWPEVESFVDGLATAARTLDVGCGNGRHAALLARRSATVVGLDASRALLRIARERASERGYADAFAPVAGDAGSLPLRDGSVDAAVHVATLHHLRSRERRVGALTELGRVLAPGAPALVSVWSVTHDRFDADRGHDRTVDWTLPGGETVARFYHVYDPDEFDADLAASGLVVERTTVSSGNCYATVRGPEPTPAPDW
jgi:ubiquinone/menaquinone biosynthesis C-methylase UbiE